MLGSWRGALKSDCASMSVECPSSRALRQSTSRGLVCEVTDNRMLPYLKNCIKYINMHQKTMSKSPNEADVAAVLGVVKAQKITQVQIAIAIGASQSQVSRVLSGTSNKRSKLINEICKYVTNVTPVVSIESVRRNEELMAALAATWDGTPKHSEALATVIRSLRVLASDAPRSARKMRRNHDHSYAAS
jgi:transcriptional regulator with XRE-family HTH domain